MIQCLIITIVITIMVVLMNFDGPKYAIVIYLHVHHIGYQAMCAKATLDVIHAYAMICGYAIVLWINDAVRTSWKCECVNEMGRFLCM